MTQKIKRILLTAGLACLMLFPVFATASVSAAPTNQTKINECLAQGSNLDLATGDCANKDTSGGGTDLTDFIAKVLNILSVVVGVVAVIMVIVGGFRYTTSGGKEEGVKSAKNSILYALIGLVIVALAQVIVRFVLNKTV